MKSEWSIGGGTFRLLLLQGIFDFQCMMDGAVLRYWKALLAPVLPLIFLILCGFFELVKRGSGCLIAKYVSTLQENLKHQDSSHPAYNLRCLIAGSPVPPL